MCRCPTRMTENLHRAEFTPPTHRALDHPLYHLSCSRPILSHPRWKKRSLVKLEKEVYWLFEDDWNAFSLMMLSSALEPSVKRVICGSSIQLGSSPSKVFTFKTAEWKTHWLLPVECANIMLTRSFESGIYDLIDFFFFFDKYSHKSDKLQLDEFILKPRETRTFFSVFCVKTVWV